MTLGELTETPFTIKEVVTMIRSSGDQKLLALHNVSDIEITVSLEDVAEFKKIDFTTNKKAVLKENKLVLPAYSSVVLKN